MLSNIAPSISRIVDIAGSPQEGGYCHRQYMHVALTPLLQAAVNILETLLPLTDWYQIKYALKGQCPHNKVREGI